MTQYYSVRAVRPVIHDGLKRVPGDVSTQDFVVNQATMTALLALGDVTLNGNSSPPLLTGSSPFLPLYSNGSLVGIQDPASPGLNCLPGLTSGGTLSKKLKVSMREAQKWNPHLNPYLSLAATLAAAGPDAPFIEYGTAGGSSISASTIYKYFANSTDLTPSGNGGPLVTVNGLPRNGDTTLVENFANYLRVRGGHTAAGVTQNAGGCGWMLSFLTDAPIVKITTLGSTTYYSMAINGKHAFPDGLNAGGTPNDMYVTHSTAKYRRFDLILNDDQGVFKIEIGTAYNLLPIPNANLEICLFGDSYPGTLISGMHRDSLTHAFRRYTGANIITQTIGGSGYITANAATNAYRLSDVIAAAPDVVVMNFGLNDVGGSAASITSAAVAVLQALRTGLPNAPIIALMFGAAHDNDSNVAIVENAIAVAVAQMSDSRIRMVMTIATDDPWLYGAATAGDIAGKTIGNALTYIGGDGVDHTHPKAPVGTHYLGARMADAVLDALVAMGA